MPTHPMSAVFPWSDPGGEVQETGLTKREYFALKAYVALLQSHALKNIAYSTLARESLDAADAFISALNEPPV